jgi:prolyl-tRNA synthetase
MKDSYSFDVDDAGLQRSYERHREAYIRAFDRLGLDYVIVAAMSGAMGGSASEEFLASAETGEDTYVRSPGGYVANVEAVVTLVPDAMGYDDAPAAHVEDTPDTPTIETLVALANERFPRTDRPWAASDTLKNVVVTLRQPDGVREALIIGLPGDREIDVKRLEAAVLPADVEPFTDADFASHPTLVRGYLGPATLETGEVAQYLGEEAPAKVRYLLDPRVVEGTRWITGANVAGRHVFDLVAGRDFVADGTIEAAEVRAGDAAPDGSGPLELARGIEIGHIFQLGRKYAEALDLKVLDETGTLVTVTMGSYGIGVSRAVAAIAEQSHDEAGLIWPREVAPADVHIVAAGRDPAVVEAADRLADDLDQAGVRVLYDDRMGVSPGVKFADSELIGVPTIVVVGRGLTDGTIEVKDRRSGERVHVPVGDVVQHLVELCGN